MSSQAGDTLPATSVRSTDHEREYIEGLLNTRFNYYLVFASLLLLATFGNSNLQPEAQAFLLAAGALVSCLIAYMVGRTRHLLEAILKPLRESSSHPYATAYQHVKTKHRFYRKNANDILVWVVWLLTTLFIIGAAAILALGSVTISASAAQAQSADPGFPRFDERDESTRLVRTMTAQASRNRVAIVVWGGSNSIIQQAYNAAVELHREGVLVSFLLGPADGLPANQAHIQVYVDGGRHSDTLAVSGGDETRLAVLRAGRAGNNQRLANEARRSRSR